jgi:hypothetical protein
VAVLGRLLISSSERLDLPDLLSIDSYAGGDWKFFLKGLVGDSKPYVLKGFDVIDPLNAIGTQSCSIRVADSMVFYPGSSAGGFYHGLAEGHVQASPLVPELRKNAVNYVYLTFSTFNSSIDTRAFWDPDKDGGAGGEFTQDVNTESVLKVDVNVSVGSFPANTIPIALITVGPVTIEKIEDARDMMFRLGSGGINPDPFSGYAWRSLPGAGFTRTEPPTEMLAGGINPFQGADKNILSLKEWMDAVMSKLRELGGTNYWYEDASTFSLISSFIDSVGTAFRSKGKWSHSTVTPGNITWTEDINIKVTADPRTYIIRDGNKTLLDEQVMYVPMVRNGLLNGTDDIVDWTNAQPYVNTVGGAVGLFVNLAKGDYVKKINDSNDKYLRVEEFYDTINLGGVTTTAANAKSIRLSGNYLGTTTTEKGRYDKGVYAAADVVVSDRDQLAIQAAGGNFHWMAMRSDTIESVSNITTTTLTLAISQHDGATAKCTSGAAHNLVDNDRVTITGSTNFNGTYSVEVESATVFYINIPGGPFANEVARTGRYATVTTATRSTLYGLQLESANHGFNSNDKVIISGTTNYNASSLINVRSATTFTIPVSGAFAVETAGAATLAKVIVRTEGSVVQVIQGGSSSIGGTPAENIRLYTGMESLSDTTPSYVVPPSYDTLDGMQNYNTDSSDNLTVRAAKLTAMMADKAQDKTIKYLAEDLKSVLNTTNGLAQELTFVLSTATLTLLQPGNLGNALVTLPDVAPGISLLVNQSAYVTLDRNAATTPSIIVANNEDIPIDENVFVIASRLSTVDCWLWDSTHLGLGGTPIGPSSGLYKVRLHDPVSTVLPLGAVIVDGVTVVNDDQVLFSNLLIGDNKVYKAVVFAGLVTSWVAQFAFGGFTAPSDADTVIVQEGNSFADTIGIFTGTEWSFNNKVRYFNGTDYWEVSSLNSAALADNQVAPADIFAINYVNSENIIVDYSIKRGALKEVGSLIMTTDGVLVGIAASSVDLAINNGITFSGVISGPQIKLQYISTSTGSVAQIKWAIRRWSDGAGGPGGAPSYSGGGGGGGGNLKVEYRTITAPEAAAKALTLAQTPGLATEVALDVISSSAQFYGTDFTVAGTVLSWNGLALDGVLLAGDQVRIFYAF